jgi:hypothetical protein
MIDFDDEEEEARRKMDEDLKEWVIECGGGREYKSYFILFIDLYFYI